MLLTKEVEVGLGGRNAKWFECKGYEIPRYKDKSYRMMIKKGTKIKVKVEDLPDCSHVFVDVKCDGCGEILKNLSWENYKKQVKEDSKYYCQKCASKLFGSQKLKITRLKNGKSFYDQCYDNLPKDKADIIMLRWDNELNVDENGNKLTPRNINYGSKGINGKGYWFKCLDHPEHISEQKSIQGIIRYKNKGISNCIQCNTIYFTHPHLIKYFVNKEDIYKYSVGSHVKISMNCLDCGFEKELVISNLINSGFDCNQCSDNLPYTEKFFANFLRQLLGNDFQTQLSKTTFKWCDKYRYDFYIDKISGICETGGLQHYEEIKGSWKMSLEEIQDNDEAKEKLAKENGIKNYMVIDCRKSDLEWIKNNIMNSELPKLLNFKESDVNWLECHEYACSSLVKVACDLWNSGINDTLKIAQKLKLSRTPIYKYLKQGAKLGWCDYKSRRKLRKIQGGENNK